MLDIWSGFIFSLLCQWISSNNVQQIKLHGTSNTNTDACWSFLWCFYSLPWPSESPVSGAANTMCRLFILIPSRHRDNAPNEAVTDPQMRGQWYCDTKWSVGRENQEISGQLTPQSFYFIIIFSEGYNLHMARGIRSVRRVLRRSEVSAWNAPVCQAAFRAEGTSLS